MSKTKTDLVTLIAQRRAADLAWEIVRATKELCPQALSRLRRIARGGGNLDKWSRRYHIADLPVLLDAAAVLARSWEWHPNRAERMTITRVRPLLPDLVIPASTDREVFLHRAAKFYDAVIGKPDRQLSPDLRRRRERQIAMFVLRRIGGATVLGGQVKTGN